MLFILLMLASNKKKKKSLNGETELQQPLAFFFFLSPMLCNP